MKIYLVIVNFLALFMYGIDKYKAQHNKWRISEKVLLLVALFGGSIGAIGGMYSFHHKTKKLLFKMGVPVILIFQIILWMYFIGIK